MTNPAEMNSFKPTASTATPEVRALAPRALHSLLHVRIADTSAAMLIQGALGHNGAQPSPLSRDSLLKELDAPASQQLSERQRELIADAICTTVAHNLSWRIRAQQLPSIPRGVPLDSLRLRTRAHNCLKQAGLSKDLWPLNICTIGDLLDLPNLGVRSLIEILSALEATSDAHAAKSVVNTVPDSELEAESSEAESEHLHAHDRRVGDALMQMDEHYDVLREDAHRFAHLLHAVFDSSAAAQTLTFMRERIKLLSQGIDTLEGLTESVEDGASLQPTLDEALSEEIERWTMLLFETPSARNISGDTHQLGLMVRDLPIDGDKLEHKIETLATRAADPPNTQSLCRALSALGVEVEKRALLTLEDELEAIVENYLDAQRTRGANEDAESQQASRAFTIQRRLGWDGQPAATLDAVAKLRGVSRERIRQVTGQFEKWLNDRCFFLPALQRTLTFIHDHLPGDADDLEATLRAAGVLRANFTLEAIADVAASFNLPAGFVVQSVEPYDGAPRMVCDAAHQNDLSRAWKAISDHVWERGIGHGPSLIEEISEESEAVAELAHLLLDTASAVCWLNRSEGWFWMLPEREVRHQENRLITQVARTLSVARRLEVARLHEAIVRRHLSLQGSHRDRLQWEMPPLPVFEEWCHQMPVYRIENDVVQMEQTPLPQDVLAPTELIMIEVLREHGPALSRWKFEQFCAARGVARPTFYLYVDGVGTIEEVAEGVYALMGAEVSEQNIAFAEAENRRINPRVLLDFGRSDDGRIWILYQASEGMCVSGNCACPSQLREALQGNFTLCDVHDAPLGTFVFRGAAGWGLGPFLRRSGQPGDDILLVFDLAQRQVTLVHNGQGRPQI